MTTIKAQSTDLLLPVNGIDWMSKEVMTASMKVSNAPIVHWICKVESEYYERWVYEEGGSQDHDGIFYAGLLIRKGSDVTKRRVAWVHVDSSRRRRGYATSLFIAARAGNHPLIVDLSKADDSIHFFERMEDLSLIKVEKTA